MFFVLFVFPFVPFVYCSRIVVQSQYANTSSSSCFIGIVIFAYSTRYSHARAVGKLSASRNAADP